MWVFFLLISLWPRIPRWQLFHTLTFTVTYFFSFYLRNQLSFVIFIIDLLKTILSPFISKLENFALLWTLSAALLISSAPEAPVACPMPTTRCSVRHWRCLLSSVPCPSLCFRLDPCPRLLCRFCGAGFSHVLSALLPLQIGSFLSHHAVKIPP